MKRKKKLLSAKEELKSYQEAKVCYICGKGILQKSAKDRSYRKVRYHCHYAGKYRGSAQSICDLKFNVPNKIPAVFHMGSSYYYHFIITELENEFEREFKSLEENKEN